MVYSDKLCAYYLELARSPCLATGFAGSDIRYSSEFETLESELEKVQSIHGAGQPDWQNWKALPFSAAACARNWMTSCPS
jgi:type VI secretion system protein VasJ